MEQSDFGKLSGQLGDPYGATQDCFLCNLVKLLNEASATKVDSVIRWHPKISNALQVNWSKFNALHGALEPILVRYKVFRYNNKHDCARASWNRKLREWKFQMIHVLGQWTTYIYKGTEFRPDARPYELPKSRRPKLKFSRKKAPARRHPYSSPA